MKNTALLIATLLLTNILFAVTMNDQGNFVYEKNDKVQQLFEGQAIQLGTDKIFAKDNKLYINDQVAANLRKFITIFVQGDEIYIVTKKTIFSFSDKKLTPFITFNEPIFDITLSDGIFHVSNQKSIYNGYKFTHNIVTENRRPKKVGFTILNKNSIHSEENTAERYNNKSGKHGKGTL